MSDKSKQFFRIFWPLLFGPFGTGLFTYYILTDKSLAASIAVCVAWETAALAYILPKLVKDELKIIITDTSNINTDLRKLMTAIPQLIEKKLTHFSIKEPVGITKDFDLIVQTIFKIENTKLQSAIIDFVAKSLEITCKEKGFVQFDQTFDYYKNNAEKFCNAANNEIWMTCLYCPLDYLMAVMDGNKESPTHLLVFNNIIGVSA